MPSTDLSQNKPADILLSNADPVAAASVQRVKLLRKTYPDMSADELVDSLIRKRCLQVAGVGAATAGAAVIPSVGAIASVAVGSMVDMNSTHRIQTELMLDIATIYEVEFAPEEKERYLMAALGVPKGDSAGGANSATEQLLLKGGQQLARRATNRVASKSIGRVLPVVGVATSAGSNILMTYSAAQRAKAYIQGGPDSVGDLDTSIRSALGLNELTLSNWTQKSLLDAALEGFDQGAQTVGRVVGKAAGKLGRFLRNVGKPSK